MTSRFLNHRLQRTLFCTAGFVVGGTMMNPFQKEQQPPKKRQDKMFSSLMIHRPPIAACSSLNELYPSISRARDKPTIAKPLREPRLKSKVAVITGASRGLGQAIAIRFVSEGASVVLLDIAKCDETLDKIAKLNDDNKNIQELALAIQCDISKEDQVKHSIEQACAHFGPRIDVLVNNACAFVFKSVEDATVEDWTTSMHVNILGHGLVTKHCLPYMKYAIDTKPAGFGPSIIFQGSISSFRGQPGCATYATMKGAIVQLARNCAYDLAKYNIRVNTICPGTIETPISVQERNDHGWTYDEWETLKTQDVFLGRVGTAEEVANAALFFASDESSYCSGAHLMVDGGAAACTVMQRIEKASWCYFPVLLFTERVLLVIEQLDMLHSMTSINAASNDDDQEEEVQNAWVIFPTRGSGRSKDELNSYITHLTFDRSTRVIPKSACRDRPGLQSVWIPNSIKKIGKEAFSDCQNLSNVDFQDNGGLKTIGEFAFYDCDALKEIKIPDTVVVIGKGAFYWCDALMEIDLPEGLSKIEANTFYGCQSLRNVKMPHSVKVIGNSAFEGCGLTSVELPKGLVKIRARAFAVCDSLSGIVLPSGLEEIEGQAFLHCFNLLGVEFAKNSHMKIDPSAFMWCDSLVNVCIVPGTIEFVKDKSIFARCVENACLSLPGPECIEPFSTSGSKLNDCDGIPRVHDRFAELPIHSLCYHASETRVDQLKRALNACSDLESTGWNQDYLGMTSFHIVATSANPRVDMLECLLSSYPLDMLTQKDCHGETMMDYSVRNRRGVRVLQMVLRNLFADWLLTCNMAAPLPKQEPDEREVPAHLGMNLNLNDQIESLKECTNTRSKRERVREILESVGFHLQEELITLLELASWKRRMLEAQNHKEGVDRESCRYQCGAEVVIENVTVYLWGDESKHRTALSVFPLLTLDKNTFNTFRAS